jgi:hypothetical protein
MGHGISGDDCSVFFDGAVAMVIRMVGPEGLMGVTLILVLPTFALRLS